MQVSNTVHFQFRECLIELIECIQGDSFFYKYRVMHCPTMHSIISKPSAIYKDFLQNAYLSALSIEINQLSQPALIIDLLSESILEVNLLALELNEKVRCSLLEKIRTSNLNCPEVSKEIIAVPYSKLCLYVCSKVSNQSEHR